MKCQCGWLLISGVCANQACPRNKPRRVASRRRMHPKPKAPARMPHATAETSREANRTHPYADANREYDAILKTFEAHPAGLTELEVTRLTGMGRPTVTARLYELRGKDRVRAPLYVAKPPIIDTGIRRENKGTGASARVYTLAAQASELGGRLAI